jgi:hypothetical protein
MHLCEAAELLATTPEAVRKRAKLGTIVLETGGDGRLYLGVDDRVDEAGRRVDNGLDGDHRPTTADRDLLVEHMASEIDHLREQLKDEREGSAELRRIVAGLVQIVPELEPAQEARDGHVTTSEEAWKGVACPKSSRSPHSAARGGDATLREPMPEDSLARRAREARKRRRELRERFEREAGDDFTAVQEEAEELGKRLDARAGEGNSDVQDAEIERLFNSIDERVKKIDAIADIFGEIDEADEDIEVVRTEATIEGSKLRSEALKQGAIFSGAAVVGIAAITRTRGLLPPVHELPLVLWAAYACLLITIAVSLVMMHMEAIRTERTFEAGEVENRGAFLKTLYFIAASGFPIATVMFALFMIANLT